MAEIVIFAYRMIFTPISRGERWINDGPPNSVGLVIRKIFSRSKGAVQVRDTTKTEWGRRSTYRSKLQPRSCDLKNLWFQSVDCLGVSITGNNAPSPPTSMIHKDRLQRMLAPSRECSSVLQRCPTPGNKGCRSNYWSYSYSIPKWAITTNL